MKPNQPNSNPSEQLKEISTWISDYLKSIESYPVSPNNISYGDVKNSVPATAPEKAESFDEVFADFKQLIVPSMVHWQHPSFFAYFPANSSVPSLLAEMLTAAIGAQCMSWDTSPAASELEERMIEWLITLLELPTDFDGIIYEGISYASLAALTTARERAWREHPNTPVEKFTLYGSTQLHALMDRISKIAGFKPEHFRKIPVDENLALEPDKLRLAIEKDLEAGRFPLAVIAALGTTSSCAIDPLRSIGEITQEYKLWLHVDGAYAGSALVLPECRWIADGMELVDSFCFNPNKWMFVNFDCTCFFTKHYQDLERTLSIDAPYLKSDMSSEIRNYRHASIPLGRRFRALKLWFVLRLYGVEGIRESFRKHIELADYFAEKIKDSDDFELAIKPNLNVVCFRFLPAPKLSQSDVDRANKSLLEQVNSTGEMLISGTSIDGNFVLRFVPAQTNVDQRHVDSAWDLITNTAKNLIF